MGIIGHKAVDYSQRGCPHSGVGVLVVVGINSVGCAFEDGSSADILGKCKG